MQIFSIQKAAEESGLTSEEIESISQEIRKEFPNDEMMFELHMIRALREASESKRAKKKVS